MHTTSLPAMRLDDLVDAVARKRPGADALEPVDRPEDRALADVRGLTPQLQGLDRPADHQDAHVLLMGVFGRAKPPGETG